ncbi:MAG: DUF4395 domain-containing protein [Bacillota bacterium]
MGEFCPIAGHTVNAKAARVASFLTTLVLLVFLLTPVKWLIFVLAADFFLRSTSGAKFSPFAAAGRYMLAALKVEPQMENAGPKLFAAKLGLFFSVLTGVLFLAGWTLQASVVAVLFLFCAALEAFFGCCLGCKMYPLLYRPKP